MEAARRGAAHARNVGARIVSGDTLVFCDADDVVGDGWLGAVGNALSHHDFVASRMDVKKLNAPWLAQCLNNVQGYQLRRAPYPPFLYHAGSSGLGIKRAIHDEVGGFDESLLQREDTDYCFRVQLRGTHFHFEPNAVIHIRYSERSNVLFRQARLWAKYHAVLYRRYGGDAPLDGVWRAYWRTWRDLLRCLPRVLSSETRPAWMKSLGTQIGLLQGAVKYRVAPICEPSFKLEIDLTGNVIQQPLDVTQIENR
jgi:GT2 family glycosyltransferase